MDNYVTGEAIKRLRAARRMTQEQLAQALGVTGKAVSRWETARGLPEARFEYRSGGWLYWYCNRHGLFREKL